MEAIRETPCWPRWGKPERPALAAGIRFCREAHTLWALRGDLMDLSSQLYGEATARKLLSRVTALFDNVVPQARCLPRPRRQRPADRWRRH